MQFKTKNMMNNNIKKTESQEQLNQLQEVFLNTSSRIGNLINERPETKKVFGIQGQKINHYEDSAIQVIKRIQPEKETPEILDELLKNITAKSPKDAAGLDDDFKIKEKDLVVIVVDYVLNVAKKNNWPMARYQNKCFVFTGTFWKQITDDELKWFLFKSAQKINVEKLTADHFIFRNNLLNQFYGAGFFNLPKSDKTETKINLANGTFVITKEKQYLKPFDANDFMLYKLDFDYNPDQDAPKFQKYLDRVLPDKSRQMVLSEYMGYVFVKNSVLKLEKALILYGDGHNGKSVFFDIILKALGTENISNYSLQSLTDEKGYHRSMLSDKILNYASEISTKLNQTTFKMLVSGEPIEARQIYGRPFILTDYARLIFNTNVLPKDIENNEGFFRRFLIIPFDQVITEQEKDVDLANSIIRNELSGVFNWILDGLKRVLEQGGFTKSEAIENALKEFKLNSDSVNLFLDDGNYRPSEDKYISLKTFYEYYREYCKESGYTACSLKTFAARLRGYNYEITRKSSQGRRLLIEKT